MPIAVLVVDDSRLARRQLQRSLPSDWDIEVTTAADGVEAMAAIKDGKAELIFLDLTMPKMDGYQVLKAIKAQNLAVTVIVVSADVQVEARKRVMALGALEFIKKPVDIEKLGTILHQFGFIAQA